MDWEKVKGALESGFNAARRFNENALGPDLSVYEHGIVGIEYVATVKIAEHLTGYDRSVFIEKHCKNIRRSVAGVRRIKAMMVPPMFGDPEGRKLAHQKQGQEIAHTKDIVRRYRFGDKDSKRTDIVATDSDSQLPKFAIEIKIHNGSFGRFEGDVSRVAELVQMCADFEVSEVSDFFGVATIYNQGVGKSSKEMSVDKFDLRIKEISEKVSLGYLSVEIEFFEICSGEEPILTTYPVDCPENGDGSEFNELLRDKMGYPAVALVARRRKAESKQF